MSWIDARNSVITISVISAAFLFGLVESILNVSITSKVLGFTIATLLGIGQAYIAFLIIKRYV